MGILGLTGDEAKKTVYAELSKEGQCLTTTTRQSCSGWS